MLLRSLSRGKSQAGVLIFVLKQNAMRLLFGFAIACSFICPNVVRGSSSPIPSALPSNQDLLVQTTSGLIQGFLDTNTTDVPLKKWLGVPYAGDTSGQNRWKPPQPVQVQPGQVINASAYGPACMQGR